MTDIGSGFGRKCRVYSRRGELELGSGSGSAKDVEFVTWVGTFDLFIRNRLPAYSPPAQPSLIYSRKPTHACINKSGTLPWLSLLNLNLLAVKSRS